MAESTKTRRFVVDASYVLAYLLPDETNKTADTTFLAHEHGEIQCISTALLPFEVGNSLRIAAVRKRISDTVARQLLIQFVKLDIQIYPIAAEKVFMLAIRKELTIYDAGYVWLAGEERVPLLTLDKQLARAAKSRLAA